MPPTSPPALRAVALALGCCCCVASQNAHNMSLVATVPLPPCTTGDVWAMGDHVLLARRFQGFAVVDVRDPANPVTKTVLPPGYPAPSWSYGVGDVKSDGRFVYATDEYTGAGVFVYDAEDPMNPVLVGDLRGTGRASSVHNCWVDGGLLYAQNRVFDVSDPSNPRFLAELTPEFTHDVVALDGRAYLSLWDDGIAIYDMTAPRVPVLLGRHRYPGSSTHNMWPSEDRQHLFTTDETAGGHVRVWDLSDLQDIRQVGSWRTGPSGSVVHNVQVHGDLLFVSYYKEGVRVLDVADPRNPVEVAWYDTYPQTGDGCFGGPYAGCFGVYPWDRDHVFVSDMDSGGYVLRLHAIDADLTARANPVAAGATIDLDFTFRNDAPTTLGAFGLVLLTDVGGTPVLHPLVVDLRRLPPAATARHALSLPVPAAFPRGWTVGFTAWAGLTSPLLVSEQQDLPVGVR